jgi:mersacidin/lichenicidin family type 2 lantibiotic
MSNIDIARAWIDEEYRHSLTQEERSQLPEKNRRNY